MRCYQQYPSGQRVLPEFASQTESRLLLVVRSAPPHQRCSTSQPGASEC